MICTTYFLTFFSELIPPTGYYITKILRKWFQLKVVCLHAEDYMLGYYLIFVPPNSSLISIWSRAVSI